MSQDRLAVDVRGLRKAFGDKVVLDGIDLAALGEAANTLGPTTRDVHALTLQVPGEGDAQMLQHRTEAAALLTEGRSLGEFDLINHAEERAARQRAAPARPEGPSDIAN